MAATTRETTCLFCSLCCPAGVAIDDYGLVTPEYPGHTAGSHHGLCTRGHFIGELLGHPSRLHEAAAREGDALAPIAIDEACRRVAGLLPQIRDGLAVVIDGNLPCEELAEAARLAREGLEVDRVVLFIPPADEAVLRGMATSSAPRLSEDAIRDCDVILAVGDPFATHPLIASPVLDAVSKARAHRLVCIDSVRGRTARFAAEFCQVRPGGEAAALAGLLRAMGAGASVPALATCEVGEAAEMAGAGVAAIEALAAAVGKAEKLGVLVSLPEGRCAAASAAAALAANVAEARGGGVCPLLSYGNAVGAWRLAAALGTTSAAGLAADIAEGRVKRLIVLGTDIVSAMPMAELSSVEIVAAASPMPSATTARAAVVLPMAMWFEVGGTMVDGAGVSRWAEAVASAPRGAQAPAAILGRLCRSGAQGEGEARPDVSAMVQTDPQADLGDVVGRPLDWSPARAEGKLAVVSRADAIGFADGSMSRQLAWPVVMEPQPVVQLSPTDAADLAAATVTLRSDGVAMTLPVEANADVPAGVAAVSPRFPETRMLFAWAATGVGPGHATMEKS